MRKLLLTILVLLGLLANAQYRNPVLSGFHPDPSVVRVDSDYYMVCSSFQYFPGVPVFHSRDLVNWQQIGNVLNRPSQLPLANATSSTGIFAPTIRYHAGTFYMITTNVGQGKDGQSGNFLVTATRPEGPWSDPVWLKQGGIDPSLYFEDGHCYMVSNPDNTITLCEIDPKTGRQLTASRPLWRGMGGRYPEAPHIYKKDGYYYLLISEGGTELAHSLTIARSRRITGPYEANPANPILTHCSLLAQNNLIQGTGHGDFVQAVDGQWWLLCLGYRHHNGAHHHMGRETFLAPVSWPKGGWPVVNGGEPLDTLMEANPCGYVPGSQPAVVKRCYDFHESAGPEWIHIQNPDESKYLWGDGRLRMMGSPNQLWHNEQPSFWGIRQEHPTFTLTTKISQFDSESGDEAGLAVYQSHDGNVQLFLNNFQGDMRVKLRFQLKSLNVQKVERQIKMTNGLWLRVASDGHKYSFYYSVNGQKFHLLDSFDCSLLSSETIGGFTGAVLGLYVYMGSGRHQSGYSFADFDYFDYEGR